MAKSKKPAPKKAAAKIKAAPKKQTKPAAKAKPAGKAKPKTQLAKNAKSKAPQNKQTKPKAPLSKQAKATVVKKTVKPTPKAKTPVRATVAAADKKSESYFKSYLKPLDDRMVILVGANERVTAGGLFIPDTVTDVSGNFQGKVMAIGRGHMNKKGRVQPLDVSVGDKVVFSQFSGSQIDVDGNNIMIIRESDVLGIVK